MVMIVGFVPDTPVEPIPYFRCGNAVVHDGDPGAGGKPFRPTGVPLPVQTESQVPSVDPESPAPRLTPSTPQNLLGRMNAGVPTPEPLPSV